MGNETELPIWESVKRFFTGAGPEIYPELTTGNGSENGEGQDTTDSSKIRQFRTVSRDPQHQMLVVEPVSFAEATALVAEIKNQHSLLVNLHLMPADQHQRLVDLLAGATIALEGQMHKVSQDIFTFVPKTISLSTAPRGQQTWNQQSQGASYPGSTYQSPSQFAQGFANFA